MEKIILLLFCFIFIGASCSFKKPGDKNTESRSKLEISANQDSDGDGLIDSAESATGSDPFVGDLPSFRGEFFEEMKLTTHLHNPRTNKFESASFQVRKNQTSENGTPIEERDYLSKGQQYLIEQNNHLAKKGSFRASFSMGEYTADDLGYYAPPRMNDLQVFPFSERVSELSKTHEFEEMELFISNRLHYEFKHAETYTDLVFDLYWFNDTKKQFDLIGTDFLSGVYQFNHSYHVPLSFKTSDKDLTRLVSVSGGRFLYLKLRDFKIIESGKFYEQLLSSIREKSIPLIYFNGENELLSWVGTNGKSANLKDLLKKALPEEAQIYNSKIVRIGERSEKSELMRDPYGESGVDHTRFQILTNEIANTPFTYSFSPGDVLGISYVRSSDPYALIPSYFGAKISSTQQSVLKTIKILRSSLMELRLNLRPGVIKSKISVAKRLLPCSLGENSKYCWIFSTEEKEHRGVQGLMVAGIIYLKINDQDFRLDKLIESKDVAFRIKNGEVIELKFSESILGKIPDSSGLTISFYTSSTSRVVCSGLMSCESDGFGCEKFSTHPPVCGEAGNFRDYSIIDQTTKSVAPIEGEAFFSIEYI